MKFKARSFGKEAGAILGDWMLRTYPDDRYTTPPPDFETESLAGFPEALLLARQALRLPKRSGWSNTPPATAGRVVLPLGRAVPKVLSYKVIKLSSFLFRTPNQREKFRKAIDVLAEEYHCGPEILALRRGTETRQAESLGDTARQLYEYVRSGRNSPVKDLNLNRKQPKWDALCRNAARIKQLLQRRRQELLTSLDVAELDENQRLTGLILTTPDLIRL